MMSSIDFLENQIKTCSENLEEIKNRIKGIQEASLKHDKRIDNLEKKMERGTGVDVNAMARELEDRRKKKSDIRMSDGPESNAATSDDIVKSDKELFMGITKEMGMELKHEDIIGCYRIRVKSSRPRHLIISLVDEQTALKILMIDWTYRVVLYSG